MKYRYFLVIIALLLCFSGSSFAAGKLIPLKDNQGKDSEYSSVLCFRFKVIDKSQMNKKLNYLNKDRDNLQLGYSLHYFDGPKLVEVPVLANGYIKDKITYASDVIYFAAKPGIYDFVGLYFTIFVGNYSTTYSFPVNAAIELNAGKAYYAGEVIINLDEFQKYTWNLFNNRIINDSIVHDFENKYPNTFSVYKKDFVSANFSAPTPIQPSKVVFSSRFTKEEGVWNESNDSLRTASFENGQYCIESKSAFNMGAEIIELPEKLGNSFDIELQCTWKNGGNAAYGFIIPGKKAPLAPKLELESRGYMFGISENGFAGIWFEHVPLLLSKVKNTFTLTNWKNLSVIKTNGSGSNTIRLQVIDRVISFYVNDIFVSRAPYNNDPGILDKTSFLYTESKYLGVFSFNKQKIEFDELKVSKFK